MKRARKKILFISNGHGEDSIAVKVIERLYEMTTTAVDIHAWPMVGDGRAYRELGIPLIGSLNLLPSCGFATLSLKLMLRDLKAGWIATHYRQVKAARSLRGKYDLVAAVGDIVVIAAAVLARSPFFFIGCAKSSYYSFLHGYTGLEKYLLRKYCSLTFPRDRLTVAELNQARVKNRYVGNPMMDDLEGRRNGFGLPRERTVIGFLPGSRTDAAENALHMLEAAAAVDQTRFHTPLLFLFAAANDLDISLISCRVADRSGPDGWEIDEFAGKNPAHGIVLKLTHPPGGEAWFVKGHFADVLRRSSVVVGTAGTANEQAVGLGKPLITFPTEGVMGKRYVKMKMQFFGPAAIEVSAGPRRIARAVVDLLADKERQKRMAAAGCERMGQPGASKAIAGEILLKL
jgi:uncharacterized protein (TIGR03492 family)